MQTWMQSDKKTTCAKYILEIYYVYIYICLCAWRKSTKLREVREVFSAYNSVTKIYCTSFLKKERVGEPPKIHQRNNEIAHPSSNVWQFL